MRPRADFAPISAAASISAAGDLETWRPGDLETWRPGDLETWRPGDRPIKNPARGRVQVCAADRLRCELQDLARYAFEFDAITLERYRASICSRAGHRIE
jgi:hypothetical protein